MSRNTRQLMAMVLVLPLCGAAATTNAGQAPVPQEPLPPPVESQDQAPGSGESAEADSDEALQQLIAQAEALAGPESPASTDAVALISEELEALKAGLALKASLLADGKPTGEADVEIAARRESLQQAIDAAAESESSPDESEPVEQESPQRGSALEKISSFVGEALDLMGTIRELLQASRADGGGAEPFDPAAAMAEEEALSDLTGIVTDSGEPLEGVSVTDPTTGASAVTDSDGQYTLHGLVAGQPVRLVLSQRGKTLGEGQVNVAAGRSAVADFELKAPGKNKRPVLGVLPYTVVVRGAKGSKAARGAVKGTLRDAAGRPVSRALVSLGSLARARTASDGRYAFLNVPVGTYDLKVLKPGHPPSTRRVQVTAARVDAPIALSPRRDPAAAGSESSVRRGPGLQLQGAIAAAGGGPVRAAKVTLIRSGKAFSVQSGARGEFVFRDLEAGSYRLVVSKGGYRSLAETVSIGPGMPQTRRYVLTAVTHAASSVPAAGPKAATRTAAEPARKGAARGRIATASVIGRVLDANTRGPIGGAVVTVAGVRVATDPSGIFRIPAVPPGSHRIAIAAAGYRPASATISLDAGDRSTPTYALTRAVPARRR